MQTTWSPKNHQALAHTYLPTSYLKSGPGFGLMMSEVLHVGTVFGNVKTIQLHTGFTGVIVSFLMCV